MWWLCAALVACVSCTSIDDAERCRQLLAKKQDAIQSCTNAFNATEKYDDAVNLVAAHRWLGGDNLDRLLATHPTGLVAGEVWHARGTELREHGDIESSIQAFKQAIAVRSPKDLRGRVKELASLSERYIAKGDLRESLLLQAQTFQLATEFGDPSVLARVRVNFADLLMQLGDAANAEQVLGDSADRLARSDPYRASALILRGTIDQARGRFQLARAAYESAFVDGDELARQDSLEHQIEIGLELKQGDLDRLLAQVTDVSHRAFLAARIALDRGRYTETLASCDISIEAKPEPSMKWEVETLRGKALLRLGRDDDATASFALAISEVEFAISELGIDELKNIALKRQQRREPYEQLFALYAKHGRALDALAAIQRPTSRAYLDGLVGHSTAQMAAVDKLATAEGARAEALRVVSHSLRVSSLAKLPSGDGLAKRLGSTIVWTYVVADKRLWLVSLMNGAATLDDLGAIEPIAALATEAAALDKTALAQLGTILAPQKLWVGLTPSTIIHIAADPPLDAIPFAALTISGTRWIERIAIAMTPSALVLATLREGDDHGEGTVVLGDPQGDLPGARAEATETATKLGVSASLGNAARAQILLDSGKLRLLSISAHADLTTGGAVLRLAERNISTADIVDHSIAAKLVVLASCASGAVDHDAWGELGGSFLAAGTANVIAARWALDDSASRDLVGKFFDANGSEEPALALAIAQRDAISRRVPESSWAALVAMGTGTTNQKGSR